MGKFERKFIKSILYTEDERKIIRPTISGISRQELETAVLSVHQVTRISDTRRRLFPAHAVTCGKL